MIKITIETYQYEAIKDATKLTASEIITEVRAVNLAFRIFSSGIPS